MIRIVLEAKMLKYRTRQGTFSGDIDFCSTTKPYLFVFFHGKNYIDQKMNTSNVPCYHGFEQLALTLSH